MIHYIFYFILYLTSRRQKSRNLVQSRYQKRISNSRHRSKELPTGTANNILKAAGIYKTI